MIDALTPLVPSAAPVKSAPPVQEQAPPNFMRLKRYKRRKAPDPGPLVSSTKPHRSTLAGAVAQERTAARQAAVLAYLKQHDGMAESHTLAQAMPKEPDLNDSQRSDAYRNTMTTLKREGKVERTGTVWSITDKGRKAA